MMLLESGTWTATEVAIILGPDRREVAELLQVFGHVEDHGDLVSIHSGDAWRYCVACRVYSPTY